jgi:hypothetical protein
VQEYSGVTDVDLFAVLSSLGVCYGCMA